MVRSYFSPLQRLNTLRDRRLGWLIPFYCSVDSHYYGDSGLTVLSVFTWRFGQQAWETWRLKEGVDADWIKALKPHPADMYSRLKLSGDLVHRHCLTGQ